MVSYHGQKMSKSLGNLVFVSELLNRGVNPAAIRLALLTHHYREDWEWTGQELVAAERRLDRWREAILSVRAQGSSSDTVAQVRTALANDLDAPSAIGAIDQWVEDAPRATTTYSYAGADLRRAIDALLGIRLY
jgi:L-cysteine:1D-myo-inositol 2-amino-2-deoxy-alpha-D-glucopyranoside ligase